MYILCAKSLPEKLQCDHEKSLSVSQGKYKFGALTTIIHELQIYLKGKKKIATDPSHKY